MTPPRQKPSGEICEMFDSLVGVYDLLNRVLSLGCDRFWRARLVALCVRDGSERVLDLCCGTGDLAIAFAKKLNASASVHALDLSPAMIERMCRKLAREKLAPTVSVARGDAADTRLPDESFDIVACGFGLRNLPDRRAALREAARLLRPGGRLGILEFTRPDRASAFTRFYIRRVVPIIGRVFTRRRENPYRYLARTIADFASADELRDDLCEIGLKNVQYEINRMGVVALHTATK